MCQRRASSRSGVSFAKITVLHGPCRMRIARCARVPHKKESLRLKMIRCCEVQQVSLPLRQRMMSNVTDRVTRHSDPKIRAEESTQKMKTYVSHIPTPHTPNSRLHPREEIVPMYSQYVPIADEYRARLRVEKPDLWLQFFPVDGNQATLSDNDS